MVSMCIREADREAHADVGLNACICLYSCQHGGTLYVPVTRL